jgi:hypothetical protein
MSRLDLDLSTFESQSCFYQSEEDQPTRARGLMHRVWLDFRVNVNVVEPKPEQETSPE